MQLYKAVYFIGMGVTTWEALSFLSFSVAHLSLEGFLPFRGAGAGGDGRNLKTDQRDLISTPDTSVTGSLLCFRTLVVPRDSVCQLYLQFLSGEGGERQRERALSINIRSIRQGVNSTQFRISFFGVNYLS